MTDVLSRTISGFPLFLQGGGGGGGGGGEGEEEEEEEEEQTEDSTYVAYVKLRVT